MSEIEFGRWFLNIIILRVLCISIIRILLLILDRNIQGKC